MAAKSLPSQEYLRQCFDYDPESGTLTWKRRPREHFRDPRVASWWNSRYAHKKAGHETPRGHLELNINETNYKVHRLIWRLVTGDEPDEIDHINCDPADNRFGNLRSATHQENCANRPAQQNNKLGFKRVTFTFGKYRAHIKVNGKSMYLGGFDTPEEAHAVAVEAARRYFGRFARG